MKRPFLIVAVLYLIGILLADTAGGASASRFWVLLFLTGGCALAGLARSRTRLPFVALGLVLAGAANLTFHQATFSPRDLRTIAPTTPTIASVRGRLIETPVLRLYTHQDHVTHRTQAELRVSEVRWQRGEWIPSFGVIAVSTAGVPGESFYGGCEVEIDGVLRVPPGPNAPDGFDYAKYLSRHGIHFQLQCSDAGDWRLGAPFGIATRRPLSDRFGAWAKAMMARGLPTEDQPLQLLWAMTLGWRTALTGEVAEPFMRSGTMHVFAISGLHVALIATLFVTILRVARVPRRWCALVVIPLLWLYAGATGWQASAVRSTVMFSVIVAGWLITRPSDLLNSLAAAAFVILLWEPQQLFQASFQLSFAVVLSLALLGPLLERWRVRVFQDEPWVPDDLRPRWQHWLRKPIDWLSTSFAVSLAAWLGSLPLVAAYFNLLTPVSLVANLIVVPLSSGALACSLGSLLVGPLLPFVGELFNHSAWFFMLLMIRASEWAAAMPFGWSYVPTPGPLPILVYYAALIGLLAGAFQLPRVRWWFGGALALLAFVCLAHHAHARSQTRLIVLPMNGGGAIHLASARAEERWLIDCGDDASAAFVLKPYLRGQGVNQIENLLFTHGDVHHAGGANVLRESFDIERAWFSPVPFRSPVYRSARRLLETPSNRARTFHCGDVLPPWTVLHPDDADRLPQADDNAVVLIGCLGGNRILLLSDLGKPGQNLLLTRYPDLRAEVVIAGIPSQSEPLADALIETVRPRLIVVADAEYPATQRASTGLRERLASHRIPIAYTRDTGALVFTFADNDWTLEATGRRR